MAHVDSWQAQGRLREPYGGGTAEFAGWKLMASGLGYSYLNAACMTDPALADIDEAREWYRSRNLPWGTLVPAGSAWPHGQLLLTPRLMAVKAAAFSKAAVPSGCVLHQAGRGDIEVGAAIDAGAFGSGVAEGAHGWSLSACPTARESPSESLTACPSRPATRSDATAMPGSACTSAGSLCSRPLDKGASLPLCRAGSWLLASKRAQGSPISRPIPTARRVSTRGSASRVQRHRHLRRAVNRVPGHRLVKAAPQPEAFPGSLEPAPAPRPGRAPLRLWSRRRRRG